MGHDPDEAFDPCPHESGADLVRESAPLPDCMADLQAWRRLLIADRAGVYNVSVAQIVEMIERKLSR